MKKSVNPIPEGYHSITPYLIVKGATKAIEFYKKVFGAVVQFAMEKPDGTVGHAELTIGSSKVMLADEHPEVNARGPQTYGGSPVLMHLYIDNVDQVVARAIENGASVTRPLQDMFYGDRSGTIQDPFGHIWDISTHIEDVPQDELEKRAAAMYG